MLILLTPPASLPVTLLEAKQQCRVEHSDDDSFITRLIEAATSYFDGIHGILGRSIIAQTWRYTIDDAEGVSEICLPMSDFSSVVISVAGVTLAPVTDYKIKGQRVTFTTPQTGVIEVNMFCGFGTAAEVPAALKHCILILISTWYNNRENVEFVAGASAKDLPFALRHLITPYKLNSVTS
jgi:hypothetical protein